MATFLTVLKSGGLYEPAHVASLASAVTTHGPGFSRFIALSDLEMTMAGVDVVPLRHDWPGWWAKLEAFRPDLGAGLKVLCDLDTIVAGPLSMLCQPGTATLEDYFHKDRVSSALMRWEATDLAFLYEAFSQNSTAWMKPGSCGPVPNAVHGDQVVIDHLLKSRGLRPAFLQKLYPGLVDFYAAHRGIVAPITVFIGETKPVLDENGRLNPPVA